MYMVSSHVLGSIHLHPLIILIPRTVLLWTKHLEFGILQEIGPSKKNWVVLSPGMSHFPPPVAVEFRSMPNSIKQVS